MPDLTRQQLCAALGISESTVRRLELLGLPFTPVGLRAKRYNLDDNYTKKTCLWTGGGFVMPTESRAEGLIEPDDRIHKCPQGPERHNIRSATPLGFARAVFEANAPKAVALAAA